MIRDGEFSTEQLMAMLKQDAIDRNKILNTFMELLNSINANAYISLDGGWGSGKTVFVRLLAQLNYMGLSDYETRYSTIPNFPTKETLGAFQEKYIAYYYNAWHNDTHEDPIQSLLFNLINDYEVKDGLVDRVKKITKQATTDSIKSGVKTITKGFINIDNIDKIKTISDLADNINTETERKHAVSRIIKDLLPPGKKFLFIIDEIDRCSPTFAVKMLEAIKHYYDDDIVFAISTNNTQLSHTIKKYYGNEFDGIGYLNKFYDLVFDMPDVEPDLYISNHLKQKKDSYWFNILPRDISSALGMSMREINRYYSSLRIINGYLSSPGTSESVEQAVIKYLFVPLALGLKTTDINHYYDFIKGRGTMFLNNLCEQNTILLRIARVPIANNADATQQKLSFIATVYASLFDTVKRKQDYDTQEQFNGFSRAITLINMTGKIDE